MPARFRKSQQRPRVVVDARHLKGGIGAYIQALLCMVPRQESVLDLHLLIRARDQRTFQDSPARISVVDLPIYGIREQLLVPLAARGADLLHVPHYNVPFLHRGKLVATIHDLTHITDSGYRSNLQSWAYARPMLAAAARRALHIVTVSEYSKTEIVTRLTVHPSRVSVIHCGVHPRFFSTRRSYTPASPIPAFDERPYLLYVGSLKPHKNLPMLLRVYSLLRERNILNDHRLVIIGDDQKRGDALRQDCRQLRIHDHVEFVPFVSDEVLPYAYAKATALILPSLNEGFGLPVIEAMACGTPVVCSRASSLPEVAGEAAEFFDPASLEEMAAAIAKVLCSSDLQDRLRCKGRQRATQFSWEECARRHMQLYRDLLEK